MSRGPTASEACLELARCVIDEINTGTVHPGIRTDDATTWHNTDGETMPLRESTAGRRPVREVVPDFRFDVSSIHAWPDGFVVQYVARGTLPDGSALVAPACLVCTVRDGRVAHFEEYVDSVHIAALVDALAISRG